MGQQASSISQRILPTDAVDSLQFEIKKQVQIYSAINNLSYEEFQRCLADLNSLARKCLDPAGKQLVFAVKKGTDKFILWKRTIRIACVKVDPATKKIDCFKLLTLQQFLQVFRTFQTNLHAMVTVESQRIPSPTSSPTHSTASTTTTGRASQLGSRQTGGEGSSSAGSFDRPDTGSPRTPASASSFVFPQSTTASILMGHIDAISGIIDDVTCEDHPADTEQNECCICMERKPEVSLPCAHSYCTPCIEQWNIHQKTCPICDEELASTDDTWVLSEMPEADEVSEEICATLMKLSVDDGDRNWWRKTTDL